MTLPGWTREPLVHFLVAGAVIFALFAFRGGDIDPESRTIDIDRETQAQIALGFERLMSRPPTDAELDAQIDRYVREEILYREALRLGLDSDDAIVRRRLAQKMDMLASARAEIEQPSEETLQQWHDDHAERFAEETRYSFDQLWFESEAAATRAKSRVTATANWQALGERISLPASLASEDRDDVLDRFGERFVAELDRIDPDGSWQGPILSGFGWHLVRLSERVNGEVPPLSAIRDDVIDDWRSATIERRREAAYQVLREAYSIQIER